MLKREWGVESNGKLPHLSIPGKTATLVPMFAVEDLTLNRTASFVPEFAMTDLPLGKTHDDGNDVLRGLSLNIFLCSLINIVIHHKY